MDNAQRTILVYSRDSRYSVGYFGALRALIRETINYRSHIRTLFASDFRASYRGSALGVIWNFILPVVPISVYILLVNLRVLPRFEGLSAAVYISFNCTLWFLLIGFIQQPLQIVRARNSTMMKTAIPLSAAIVSSFARLSFDTLVRTAVVIGLIVVMQDWPALTAPLALAAVLAGAIFCTAAGFLLSVINVAIPDIERVVSIALQYGMFLSGVIFPIATIPQLAFLQLANPLSVFIHAARDLAFFGALSQPIAFSVWAAIGLVSLLVSARFFYVMEYRLRDLS